MHSACRAQRPDLTHISRSLGCSVPLASQLGVAVPEPCTGTIRSCRHSWGTAALLLPTASAPLRRQLNAALQRCRKHLCNV